MPFLLSAKKKSKRSASEKSQYSSQSKQHSSQRLMVGAENLEMTTKEKTEWHLLLLEHFIKVNIPLSSLRTHSEDWEEIFGYANQVLGRHMPNVDNFNTLLKRRSADVDAMYKDEFQSCEWTTMNLMIDGWTSVSRSHLLGIIVSREHIDWSTNQQLDEETDTGLQNAKLIEDIILRLENKFQQKFGALITDSAAQLVKAKKLLSRRFPNMVFLPCLAHQINLIAKKIFVADKLQVIGAAQDLVTKINNSNTIYAQYRRICRGLYGSKAAISLKTLVKTR